MSLTIGDLISGITAKFKGTGVEAPAQNLPQMQAAYQQYATDAMTRGQQPLPFKEWVVQQQTQAQGQQ